mgnify:CR=1 FL=1
MTSYILYLKLKKENIELKKKLLEYEDIIILQKDVFIFMFVALIIAQVVYIYSNEYLIIL